MGSRNCRAAGRLAVLALAAACIDALAPVEDTIVAALGAQQGGFGLFAYDTPTCLRRMAGPCTGSLRALAADPSGQYVFGASSTNVFRFPFARANETVATNCGDALLASGARQPLRLAVDANYVYFTDAGTGSIYRIPTAGPFPATAALFIGSGVDGLTGRRQGLAVYRSTLLYTVDGTSSGGGSAAGTRTAGTIMGIYQSRSTASDVAMVWNYTADSRQWLPDELSVDAARAQLVWAEKRVDPSLAALQRVPLDANFGPGGGNAVILASGLNNSYDVLPSMDSASQMLWWANVQAGTLCATNATNRQTPPVLFDLIRVGDLAAATLPGATVQGLVFMPSTRPGGAGRFSYPASVPYGGLPGACGGGPTPVPFSGASATASLLTLTVAVCVCTAAAAMMELLRAYS